MKLFAADNTELMNIVAFERDGDVLVIKGKVFGAMPIAARLRPPEARAAMRMLDFRLALFILSLPFRRN